MAYIGPIQAAAKGNFRGKKGFRRRARAHVAIKPKRAPMYRHVDGKIQYYAFRNQLQVSLTANDDQPGVIKISQLLSTPLWSRVRQLHDVGRICGFSIKVMPTQTPAT